MNAEKSRINTDARVRPRRVHPLVPAFFPVPGPSRRGMISLLYSGCNLMSDERGKARAGKNAGKKPAEEGRLLKDAARVIGKALGTVAATTTGRVWRRSEQVSKKPVEVAPAAADLPPAGKAGKPRSRRPGKRGPKRRRARAGKEPHQDSPLRPGHEAEP